MIKPGWKTTEFWQTTLLHVISLVAMVLTLTNHTFNTGLLYPLIPTAALLASGLAQGFYSQSRASVKAAAPVPPPVAANGVPPFSG